MNSWELRRVPFKYQLGELGLFAIGLPLQVRSVMLTDSSPAVPTLIPPADALPNGSQGFQIRSARVSQPQRPIGRAGAYLSYVPLQYDHYFIDLRLTFEQYKNNFSSKTRSTIKRKVKKFSDHCGGELDWRAYQEPKDMREFYEHARTVSQKTYQERLLDAGLPDHAGFVAELEQLAGAGLVRAYILFDRGRPVSYLYCPVRDGVLIYEYLGYDPEYLKLSVGIVLQWLALERLFAEQRFSFFDFTEGESEHKRLFSTTVNQCANVVFLRNTLRNRAIVYSHYWLAQASTGLGASLERLGLKAHIKKWLRFAGRTAT